MVAKRFAAVDVAEVNLYRWQGNGRDRISDRHTGVGVSASVDQNTLVNRLGGVNGID